LIASKEFAHEHRWRSWWHLYSTLLVFLALIAFAVSPAPLLLRMLSSLTAGLVCVRLFIIFHDYQHRAILRNSRWAGGLLWVYGILTLNPPSVWNRSHGHHHRHNSKLVGTNIGSYPVMSKIAYGQATPWERVCYAASRHPLTIACGYLAIFFWGMSLRPFLQHPRKHWDGGVAVATQLLLLAALFTLCGVQVLLLGMLIPIFVACMIGAYLFYAQHNFPEAKLSTRSEWSYVEAALRSSSYTRMGPLMNWFTGNIGFHHVHHLNALIPFYRLPEAMAALDELQSPAQTSLHPGDIAACLRLKLWDTDRQRFVGFND
jgi:acyl-lipid omega-6 desaturase (Delta-12 desaturase)